MAISPGCPRCPLPLRTGLGYGGDPTLPPGPFPDLTARRWRTEDFMREELKRTGVVIERGVSLNGFQEVLAGRPYLYS